MPGRKWRRSDFESGSPEKRTEAQLRMIEKIKVLCIFIPTVLFSRTTAMITSVIGVGDNRIYHAGARVHRTAS